MIKQTKESKPPTVRRNLSEKDRAEAASDTQRQLREEYYERQAALKRKRKVNRPQPRAVGSTRRLQS